jgi:predicted NAD/FAD-dependent oxidoreductase
MPEKILVVGGGLTGAVAAYRLRKALGKYVDIECWEYLNDAGGRLATTKEQGVVADVATSVISLDVRKAEVQKLQDLLLSKGYLKEADESLLAISSERPAGPTWHHFFVPHGTSSLVEFLFQMSVVKVKTNCCVDLCSLDRKKWKWYVEASGGKSGGSRHAGVMFDAVVLCNGPTHPGCDRMDNIWGEWQRVIDSVFWDALWSVSWSSCYVVTISLTCDCLELCDGFFGVAGMQRTMNDDVIHYITYESRKRQHLTGKQGSSIVLVCHTTAEAMWNYKRARCVEVVQERVLKYLKLPLKLSHRVIQRSHSRCWGKCQVNKTISSILHRSVTHWASRSKASPPLVLCGDYFSGPTCSDAIVSATSAADAIAKMLRPNAQAEAPEEVMEQSHAPWPTTSFLTTPSGRWADEPVESIEEMEDSTIPYPGIIQEKNTSCPSKTWEESKTPYPNPIWSPSRRWGRNGPRIFVHIQNH